MAQITKIEAKAEIKCSPAKFYNFYKCNQNQFANMLPHIFKSIRSLEGEEGQVGNVLLFEYDLGGKKMSLKTTTEAVNDEERSITFRVVESEMMQMYTSYRAKATVGDGFAHWFFEFEKANDSVPNPDSYAKLAVEMAKILDAYLLSH